LKFENFTDKSKPKWSMLQNEITFEGGLPVRQTLELIPGSDVGPAVICESIVDNIMRPDKIRTTFSER
jgi:hypothetical protein